MAPSGTVTWSELSGPRTSTVAREKIAAGLKTHAGATVVFD